MIRKGFNEMQYGRWNESVFGRRCRALALPVERLVARSLPCAMVLLFALAACSKNKPEQTIKTSPPKPQPAQQDEVKTVVAPPAPEEQASASLAQVIYFAFDSSELDEKARERLNRNAEWLREDAARTLLIEGHTDETGTVQYNLGLGDRRARAAKEFLVRLGIDTNRVQVITFGEEKPASREHSRNRRSVFVATDS